MANDATWQQHVVDAQIVNALSDGILRGLDGARKVDAEIACLVAYAGIADGVRAYPASTRAARLNLLVHLGSQALCDLIAEIGALSSTQVLAHGQPTGICH